MKKKLLIVLVIASVGVVLDLWSKAWMEGNLKGQAPIEVVPDFFHFTYVENPHGAFSMFEWIPESVRRPGLIVASILAVLLISVILLRPGTGWWMVTAFALVLSGAVGNLYDRLVFGHVRDFIDWHYYRDFTWPTFNIADSCISVGVTILVVITLFSRPAKEKEVEVANAA